MEDKTLNGEFPLRNEMGDCRDDWTGNVSNYVNFKSEEKYQIDKFFGEQITIELRASADGIAACALRVRA